MCTHGAPREEGAWLSFRCRKTEPLIQEGRQGPPPPTSGKGLGTAGVHAVLRDYALEHDLWWCHSNIVYPVQGMQSKKSGKKAEKLMELATSFGSMI